MVLLQLQNQHYQLCYLCSGITFGKDPLVGRTIKGMFRERPSLPRHTVVFDTDVILKYINSLPPNDQLSLELLTKKLVTLLCILSGQRAQSIVCLSLDHMHKSGHTYTFYIPKVLKTTSPVFHQKPLEFEVFSDNPKLCVFHCLEEYIRHIEPIRLHSGNIK